MAGRETGWGFNATQQAQPDLFSEFAAMGMMRSPPGTVFGAMPPGVFGPDALTRGVQSRLGLSRPAVGLSQTFGQPGTQAMKGTFSPAELSDFLAMESMPGSLGATRSSSITPGPMQGLNVEGLLGMKSLSDLGMTGEFGARRGGVSVSPGMVDVNQGLPSTVYSDPTMGVAFSDIGVSAAPPGMVDVPGLGMVSVDTIGQAVAAYSGPNPAVGQPSGVPGVSQIGLGQLGMQMGIGPSGGGVGGGVGGPGGDHGVGGGHGTGGSGGETGQGGYAKGTGKRGAKAGYAWVGERGPELVRFKGGETVIPSAKSRALAPKLGMGQPEHARTPRSTRRGVARSMGAPDPTGLATKQRRNVGYALGTEDQEDIPFPRPENPLVITMSGEPPPMRSGASPADDAPVMPETQVAQAQQSGPWTRYQRQTATDAPPEGAAAGAAEVPAPAAEAPTEQPAQAEGPWTRYGGTTARRGGLSGGAYTGKPERTLGEIEGRDPRVDYKTGTDFADMTEMVRASNPNEQRRYLERRYGAGKVFQDKGGQFYVDAGGKLVAPLPGIESSGFLRRLAPAMYADAPVLAGAAMGGAAAGPFAPVGAVLGGLAGYAANELYKGARGTYDKTPGQAAEDVAGTAGGLMLGEGLGRAILAAPGTVTDAYRSWTGAAPGALTQRLTGRAPSAMNIPEVQAMSRRAQAYGGVPPLESSAPEGKISQWHAALYRNIFGDAQMEARNVAAIDRQVRDVLRGAGIPENEIDAVATQIFTPSQAISSAPVDQALASRTRAVVDDLSGQVRQLAADADRHLDQQFRRLDVFSRAYPAGSLGRDIGAPIEEARRDFSRAAQRIYQRAEQAAVDPNNGEPIRGVLATLPQQRVRQMLAEMGPAAPGGGPAFANNQVMANINRIANLPDAMTLTEAQYARSFLRNLADDPTLTPGIPQRQLRQLADSFDQAIREAARNNPEFAQARRLLEAADRFYADGIRRFEDQTVNKLVQQARSGVEPDPEIIASMVLKPGNAARAGEIRAMVGPAMWRRIAAADWDDMMRGVRDPVTRAIDTRKLAAALVERDRGGMLDAAYGRSQASRMRQWARDLAVRDDRIPATGPNRPDTFGDAVMQMRARQRELDTFMGENYLAALARPEMKEQATQFLAQPRQEARLARAIEVFGDQSPEIAMVRQQFLKEALHQAVEPTRTGVGVTIGGNKLMAALDGYTPRQLDMLLPDGQAQDVLTIARQANFLFPQRGKDMAASLAAGALKAALPFGAATGMGAGIGKAAAIAAAEAYITGRILNSPWFARVLADGLRQGGPAARITRETIMALAREQMLPGTRGSPAGLEPAPPQATQPRPEAPWR